MSDIKPEDYSCEILLEKTTPEKAKDSSFPTDAYNVTYTVDGEDRLDVCRAQKAANIFDLYYDKYKNVKGIEYGSGTIPPNRFGLKPPPNPINIIVLSLGLSCTNASCTFDFSISNFACPAEYKDHL